MSLPKYAQYKPSGESWLGNVPSHWRQSALKRLGTYQNGYAFKPGDWGDVGLPIIRIAQLTNNAEPDYFSGELDPRLRVSDGDLLFSWSATLDSYIWQGGEAWLNQHIFKVTPTAEVTKSYLFYLIKYFAPKLADVDAHGSTMRHIKKDSLTQTVFLPPPVEQVAIASFLDRETAKIDALIAEQEKLLALLAEKRQATISRAVMQGLNPNAPLKPSGADWLANVPAHWSVVRIKWVVESIEQGWSPQCENYPVENDHEWGVLKVGCVNGGVFNAEENKKLPDDLDPLPQYALREGDLLVSRANTRELVGGAAVVPRNFDRLMLCDKLYRLRLTKAACIPHFLAAFLSTREARGQIELAATGATSSMLNIGQSVMLNLTIPLPDTTEQTAIIGFLTDELRKLDRLGTETERAIALLRERRSALITAAVTGKIDVRNAVPEELAA